MQFVGALRVREYAKGLWLQEMREEARIIRDIERRALAEEGWLPVIDEEDEDLLGDLKS